MSRLGVHLTRKDDERILHMLDLRDHEGLNTTQIAERMSMTKNAVIGVLNRVTNTFRDDNGHGNGTMPRRWWKC